MQWEVKYVVTGTFRKRVEVTTVPSTLMTEVALEGLSSKEREKKLEAVTEELKTLFAKQVYLLIRDYLSTEKPKTEVKTT